MILFSCEHAGAAVPAKWRLRAADRRLLSQHWGYDIGARSLAVSLARRSHGAAVVGRWSRLVCDLNRAPDDPTLILEDCGGEGAPTFNRAVTEADRADRVRRYYEPWHAELDAAMAKYQPSWLISIHSFTPIWRGQARRVEAGVLFDQDEAAAMGWVAALAAEGFVAAPNEPYSGMAGLIYSPARHGRRHGVRYLELEIRQDLISSERKAEAVAARVWRSMRACGIVGDSAGERIGSGQ